MTVAAVADDGASRRFPPVAQLASASLALVVVGGVYMASWAPRRPPLEVPSALLAGSSGLLLIAAALLVRLRDFAWHTFVQVGRWALLAYVVSAAMIEFAFIHDRTQGAALLVVSLFLVLFAVDVPLIIAFTVARYQSRRDAS